MLAKTITFIESLGTALLYRELKLWQKFHHPRRAPLGSVASPSDPQNYINTEWIVVFSKGQPRLESPSEEITSDLTSDEYRQFSVDTWFAAPISQIKQDHVCPFPSKIARRAIKLWSWPTGLVIDPYNGTGTTTAVAAEHHRRFIGIDIDQKYCHAALERTIGSIESRRHRARKRKGGAPMDRISERLFSFEIKAQAMKLAMATTA